MYSCISVQVSSKVNHNELSEAWCSASMRKIGQHKLKMKDTAKHLDKPNNKISCIWREKRIHINIKVTKKQKQKQTTSARLFFGAYFL